MNIKERILELRTLLNQHNVQYYVNDSPTISDLEYDNLLRELENLEKEKPHLKTIKAIPLSINSSSAPKLLEIRGEVFINHNDFKKLNEEQINQNRNIFANPRNCAAGSLRQLDPNIAKSRPLRIFCYAPGKIEGINFSTQKEFLDTIKKWGFPVNQNIKIGKGVPFLKEYYQSAESLRKSLEYDIDGVVFKINSYKLQNILGS